MEIKFTCLFEDRLTCGDCQRRQPSEVWGCMFCPVIGYPVDADQPACISIITKNKNNLKDSEKFTTL